MSKMKIHELAKKLNISSKELIEKANVLGVEVTSHMSSIEDFQAEKLEKSINRAKKNTTKKDKEVVEDQNKKVQKSKEVKAKKEKVEKKQEDTKISKKEEKPVIIRREVIITDETVEEETKKKETDRRAEVGFVEQNRKTDYNIVYRKQVSKPLTADELFGIKSVEKKQENSAKAIAEETVVSQKIKTEEKSELVPETKPTTENPTTENSTITEKPTTSTEVTNVNKENNQNRPEYNNRTGYNNRDNNNRPPYNRDNNQGGTGFNRDNSTRPPYNRDNNNNRPGFNRDNNNRPPYNRDNNTRPPYNRDNNQGSTGFNRDNNNRPPYNRDNNQGSTGFNRDNNTRPPYNRDNNQGSTGFNRDNNNRPPYNRDNNNNRPGFNRDNNTRPPYNRDNNNNRPGFNRDNNNRPPYNNSNNNNRPGYNNRTNQGGGQYANNGKRALDNYGIEKNIKNIMTIDTIEKENVREYQNKAIDKQKFNNKFEEKNKKTSKTRKNEEAEISTGKLKDLKQSDKLSHMFNEGSMLDYYDLTTERGRKNRRKNPKDNKEVRKQKIFKLTEITIPERITVKELATEVKKTSGEVIKKLFDFGIMATINNDLDFDTAFLVCQEFGITAIKKEILTEEDILFDDSADEEMALVSRPPVVVVMGHVDHGKTSLLDAVRKTNVIEGEAGGITQHIGAYKVEVNGRQITFLDTPGHEAFTSMRARGAQITDIAILVVAANDGIMPQTIEAINHAKAAGIPIVVAVNKIDLDGADIEKIKQAMTEYELVPEEWGGDTIYVPISAKYDKNIDKLLEMVLLVADMKDLRTNPHKQAKGVIIEARLDKTKGPIATMLVQRGTLDVGDTIIVGSTIGRIRQMANDKGQKVKKAGPSTPVEISGLSTVPTAGETFYEVKDEKTAKQLIERRRRQERDAQLKSTTKITAEDLFSVIGQANIKQIPLIVKADVQGSVEAVKQALEKLTTEEVKIKVIHSGVGAVTETDVNLAKVSKAKIIVFNTSIVSIAKEIAEKSDVDVRMYSIIYKAIEDIERAMKGLEEPVYEQKMIGTAEARQIFKVSNVGTIAGCYVLTGKITRNSTVKVLREGNLVFEGKINTLKRFKDDVKEVNHGYECGIQIEDMNDIKEGDILEAYVLEEIKQD